jgi:superfamily II DNA or RNA helicase
LGINCLDEGLDVPESDKCIIVSSTTNPRQFIQRRGRVLRKTKENPTKIAEVYDTIVIPNYRPPNRELTEEEEKEAERMATLIQKEIDRVKQLSDSADNQQDVIRELEQWIAANRLGDYVNV